MIHLLRLFLLRLTLHKQPPYLIRKLRAFRDAGDEQEQRETLQALQEAMPEHFAPSPDSISTPLGHVPYKRQVNPHASLDEGVERARNRSYVPFGEEMSDAEDEAFWRDHPDLARFRHVRGDE